MARPKGTKYIETPEKMWELFVAYKESVKANPRYVYEYHGKDGTQVKKPLERPLTMEGFECYVMDNSNINYPDLSEYFEGKNESYKDYFPITTRIRREIRADQLDGGLVNQYNSNLTARVTGLVDKQESNTNITSVPIFGSNPLDA